MPRRSSGIAATSRKYTGRSASETIERPAANGVIPRRIQNVRGGRNDPRSTCGGTARSPNVSAAEPARSAAAIAIAARNPIDDASTPAIGAPTMLPAKYAPRTIPSARPSSLRGVVDVTYAMLSGRPAVPDQYNAEPTNAPCQSVSGTNVATPSAGQSHAAVMRALRPVRAARKTPGCKNDTAPKFPR